MTTMLTVDNLRVRYPTRTGVIEAVRGVSFTLGRERLGIVGESGSGKSQTGRAIMGLTPPHALVSADTLNFSGIDLLSISAKQRRSLRGKRIAMVLQDPKYSLDPVMTIGKQITETLRTHEKISKGEARDRALAMLEAVQIRDPGRVYDLHPHEVSGGMGQRVMIAMMLIAGPELLIADEPTGNLDTDTGRQIADLLFAQQAERGTTMLLVTHDPALAARCSRQIRVRSGEIENDSAQPRVNQAAIA